MDQLPLPSGLLDVGGIRVADGVVVLETLNGRGVLALNALREVFLATRERLRLRHHAAKQRLVLDGLRENAASVQVEVEGSVGDVFELLRRERHVVLLRMKPMPRRSPSRSEEHPSELLSLLLNSFADFC